MTQIICYEKALASELDDSPQSGNFSTTYIVQGTGSEFVARQTAIAVAPQVFEFDGLTYVVTSAKTKALVPDAWEVDITWGSEDASRPPPEAGFFKVEFDTSGGTTKITQSKRTIGSYSWNQSAFPAPDLKGAIGWDGKQVKGVEVGHPALKLVITAYYAAGAINHDWVAELARKSWRTNSAVWLGFQPGELLFTGGKGAVDVPTRRGPRVGCVPVTLNFEASENITDLVLNTQITVARKDGWHHMWSKYHEEADAIVGPVPRPEYVYVEEVYDSLDFATFFGFGS